MGRLAFVTEATWLNLPMNIVHSYVVVAGYSETCSSDHLYTETTSLC